MSSAPSPDAVTRMKGAPRFFKRLWDPEPDVLAIGRVPGGLTIYGFAAHSQFAEDRRVEDEVWARRRGFMAWSFSILEPDGEPGFQPLSEVEEITREEFDEAQARGWR